MKLVVKNRLAPLSEYYRRGHDWLDQFSREPGFTKQELFRVNSATAYCRTEYIDALRNEVGPERAVEILDQEFAERKRQ